MSIDVCDKDFIWSSGKITKLHPGQTYKCSVRYLGWGPEWDEIITWGSPRLARISSYAKLARCIVYINKSTPWPCLLSLRMPSPITVEQNRIHAENSLSNENLVFVQPFGLRERLVPHQIVSKVSYGGMWLDTKNVFSWKELNRISSRDKVPNFSKVYDLAMRYDDVKETVPANAFEKGSLLREMYRVQMSHDFENEDLIDFENGTKKTETSTRSSMKKNAKVMKTEPSKKIYSSREKSSRLRGSSSSSDRKRETIFTSQGIEKTYIPSITSNASFDFQEFEDKPNGLKGN